MNDIAEDIILKKYDIYADDYSDYPHKSNWSKEFGDKEYRTALNETFSSKNQSPTLLYVHIPFCRTLCYYCICHKEITSDYNKILDHFNNYLSKELKILNQFLKENSLNPNFKEIFLGGGSPTLLEKSEFDRLIELISEFCNIKNLDRFCIEVDPRTCSPEKLEYYIQKGINNISIGIQDFDHKVQKAVNRVQPVELVKRLLTPDIRKVIKSINFDFLVGLPFQTESSIEKTMKQTVELNPDRISFCFFHYTTKFNSHMKLLEKDIPDFAQRKRIFITGVNYLLNNGYIRTGFEHFAKADDIVAKSIREKKATYTSLGAIGKTTNVIAIGRSGHSILEDNYLIQNFYEQDLYATALSKNEFPIYRGKKLTKDDALRRYIIRQLKTYFAISIPYIENRINESFKNYFKNEIDLMNEFINDDLVHISAEEVAITEKGKLFTDLIASIFDNYLTHEGYPGT